MAAAVSLEDLSSLRQLIRNIPPFLTFSNIFYFSYRNIAYYKGQPAGDREVELEFPQKGQPLERAFTNKYKIKVFCQSSAKTVRLSIYDKREGCNGREAQVTFPLKKCYVQHCERIILKSCSANQHDVTLTTTQTLQYACNDHASACSECYHKCPNRPACISNIEFFNYDRDWIANLCPRCMFTCMHCDETKPKSFLLECLGGDACQFFATHPDIPSPICTDCALYTGGIANGALNGLIPPSMWSICQSCDSFCCNECAKGLILTKDLDLDDEGEDYEGEDDEGNSGFDDVELCRRCAGKCVAERRETFVRQGVSLYKQKKITEYFC